MRAAGLWICLTCFLLALPQRALAQAASSAPYRLSFGDSIALSSSIQGGAITEQSPQLREGRAFPVRPDGRVTLPLIGEVQLGGMTVAEATELLNARYAPYLGRANLTLNVVQFASRRIAVLGEVNRPGTVEFQLAPTLLEAIARAGGLTDWAHARDITLYREGRAVAQLDFDRVLTGESPNVTLQDGDVIRVTSVWYKPVAQNAAVLAAVSSLAATLALVLIRLQQ